MERREFLAHVAAAPIAGAAALSTEALAAAGQADAAPQDAGLIDGATKLEIIFDPASTELAEDCCEFKICRHFGENEEDEHAEDGFQTEKDRAFHLIHTLLEAFKRNPSAKKRPHSEDDPLTDDELIDRASRLEITIYRDEHLSGHVDLVNEIFDDFDESDTLRLLRELTAAFERRRVLYIADEDDKLRPV